MRLSCSLRLPNSEVILLVSSVRTSISEIPGNGCFNVKYNWFASLWTYFKWFKKVF